MCICKENYSFYKDITQCKSNEELRKIPTYIDNKDQISGINIYDDCYRYCSKCSKRGFSYEEQNCDECKVGYILKGNNCIENYVESIKEIEGNICLSDKNIWFVSIR